MKRITLRKNLMFSMSYQALILILPLITTPYISRVIGAQGVGTYSYYHSISLYFVYFAMLGISVHGNRCIAACNGEQHQLNTVFTDVYALQLCSSGIVLFAYLAFIALHGETNRNIVLINLLHVASAVFDVSWIFTGLQEFVVISVRQILIRLAMTALIFLFVKTENDLWIYALIMAMSYFLSAISLWVMVWKKVSFLKVDWERIKAVIKPCVLLFIPVIATSVYRVMDKIMLGYFCSMAQIGYYESAEKLIVITMGVISSFCGVLTPRISNLLATGKEQEARRLFDISMEFGICAGIAIGFGIAAVSEEFIPLFFGEEYRESIVLSELLSISVLFVAWSCILRMLWLIPNGNDGIYIRSIIVGACLNFVCNIILIPMVGVNGAVIGTLAAEGSVAAYQAVRLRKTLDISGYVKNSGTYLLIGGIMLICVRLAARVLNDGIFGLCVEILVGAGIYCLLAWLYLVRNRRSMLNEVLMRKNRDTNDDTHKN